MKVRPASSKTTSEIPSPEGAPDISAKLESVRILTIQLIMLQTAPDFSDDSMKSNLEFTRIYTRVASMSKEICDASGASVFAVKLYITLRIMAASLDDASHHRVSVPELVCYTEAVKQFGFDMEKLRAVRQELKELDAMDDALKATVSHLDLSAEWLLDMFLKGTGASSENTDEGLETRLEFIGRSKKSLQSHASNIALLRGILTDLEPWFEELNDIYSSFMMVFRENAKPVRVVPSWTTGPLRPVET